MSSAMEGSGGGGAPSARRRKKVCIVEGIRARIDRESGVDAGNACGRAAAD
jgi:hypothetical protein